mmetsp:Transcript_149025/g.415303  ORF Transcript_149025/g.415303 Transcript_149025/m.415303 type:complete len:235 (-) Transcript_149025:1013-1717(-)
MREGEGLGELLCGAARVRDDVLNLRTDRRPKVLGQGGRVGEPLLLQQAQVLEHPDVPHHQGLQADAQGRRKGYGGLDHLLELVETEVFGQERDGALRLRAHLPTVPELHGARRLEGVALHPRLAEVPVSLHQILPQQPACFRDGVRWVVLAVECVGLHFGCRRIEEREGYRVGRPLLNRQVHVCTSSNVECAPLTHQCCSCVAKQVPKCAVERRGQWGVAHEIHHVEARCEGNQ